MRALLERWRSDMLNATKARHITPDQHGNWTVTDQLALTLIFTVCVFPLPDASFIGAPILPSQQNNGSGTDSWRSPSYLRCSCSLRPALSALMLVTGHADKLAGPVADCVLRERGLVLETLSQNQ